MYELTIKNGETIEKLHEMKADSSRRVSLCNFTCGVNLIPQAEFALYPQNPCYDAFEALHTLVEIDNTKTNEAEFEGRVTRTQQGMTSAGIVYKKVWCEGLLAYLCDTVQMYHVFTNIRATELVQWYVDNHNAQSSAEKQIARVVCDVSGYAQRVEVGYRSTMDEIKENLISRWGGELTMKRENGDLVLYYMQTDASPSVSPTKVELAWNMSSIVLESNPTYIVTRLIPLGAMLTNASGDQTGERLTISSVNEGVPYIDDQNAIEKYGIVVGTATFDEIEDAQQLMTYGTQYLALNNRVKRSYTSEVLDLSTIGKDADAFREGKVYHFYNRLVGIDEDLRIMKRTVDIFEPYKPRVEIGDKTEKITTATSRTAKLLEYELPKQKIDILASAKATAASLINAGFEGYVTVNPSEILIMNTPDKETATKVWCWNIGGLGYSSSTVPGEAYHADPEDYSFAITMDGAIVADFITAGVLRGIEITNGNGTFHVDKNGVCTANTFSSNNAIITGGKITINSASETYDAITLNSGDWHGQFTPLQAKFENDDTGRSIIMQAGGIWVRNEDGNDALVISSNGIRIWSDTNNWQWITGDTVPALNSKIDGIVAGYDWQISTIISRLNDHETRISALEGN